MPAVCRSRHAHHTATTAVGDRFGGYQSRRFALPTHAASSADGTHSPPRVSKSAGPERPFWATRQMPPPTFTPTYGARDGRDGCVCPAPPAAAAAAESAAVPKKQFPAAAVSCYAAAVAAGSAAARPLRLLQPGASLLLFLLLLAPCVLLLVQAWGSGISVPSCLRLREGGGKVL